MAYETKAAARRRKLKDALISAAERTIDAEGLRGLKARELAAEVGCAVGAIYNVVTDLDDLIFVVNARTLAALEETLGGGGARRASRPVRRAPSAGSSSSRSPIWISPLPTRRAGAQCSTISPCPRGQVPEWYLADQMRLFSYVEEPLKVLQPGIPAAPRALIARSLVSAVHGIVGLGLEEKLQKIPLPTLREQVILMVEAIARGLSS